MDISKKGQTSYVRAWAKKKEKEARYINELNPELLFSGVVYGISGFGQNWQSLSEPNNVQRNKKQYADKPYSGDSSAFEIGCFFYTNIDMWLFGNKPEVREKLSVYLYERFIDLFSEALPIGNVHELFAERVEKYGELFRNNENIETIHSYLTELIRRTKYDTPPKRADFDNSESFTLTWPIEGNGGLLDELSLKTTLMTFLATTLPAMIEILENYVSAKEEKKPANHFFLAIKTSIIWILIITGIIAFLTYLAD